MKPFDEHVEGLSRYRAKSRAVERAIQAHDFEDAARHAAMIGVDTASAVVLSTRQRTAE